MTIRHFSSKREQTPLQGSSATFAWLATLSNHVTAHTVNSQSKIPSKMRRSKPMPTEPDTSLARMNRYQWTPPTGHWVGPLAGHSRTARASNSQTMFCFWPGLKRLTVSTPSFSEKNDNIAPCPSNRTPPTPPSEFSKQASVYRWKILPTVETTLRGPPAMTRSRRNLRLL